MGVVVDGTQPVAPVGESAEVTSAWFDANFPLGDRTLPKCPRTDRSGRRVSCSAMTTVTEPLTPDDIDLGFVAAARARPRGRHRRRRAGRHRRRHPARGAQPHRGADLPVPRRRGDARRAGRRLHRRARRRSRGRGGRRPHLRPRARRQRAARRRGAPGARDCPTGSTPRPPPRRSQPGDELDDFTLPDLDGDERSLSDFRGKRVLLVNWSPGLRVLRARSPTSSPRSTRCSSEHDVELVFVTIGDADANRAVLARRTVSRRRRCCAATPMSTRSTGTGTPAAYLLDERRPSGRDDGGRAPTRCRCWRATSPAWIPATPYGAPTSPRRRGRRSTTTTPCGASTCRRPGAMCGPGGGRGRVEQHRLAGHARLRTRRLPRRPPLRRRRDGRRARPSLRRRAGQRPPRARQLLGRARGHADDQGCGRVAR